MPLFHRTNAASERKTDDIGSFGRLALTCVAAGCIAFAPAFSADAPTTADSSAVTAQTPALLLDNVDVLSSASLSTTTPVTIGKGESWAVPAEGGMHPVVTIGVAIILCGVTIPILFDEEVGAAFFLFMVGIAVAVFVAFGIRDAHRWEYLDERKIYVSRSDVETLNKAYQKFQKRFMVVITSGIFLIIFGLCATVAADALIHDAAERYGAILFYFTAAAMLLIIPAGIMNGAYRRFIYFEAANKEKDKEKQASRYAFIWGITMPLAAMVFLFIGLTQESWEIVWIIFPIVAILTAGLINILEYCNSRREEK